MIHLIRTMIGGSSTHVEVDSDMEVDNDPDFDALCKLLNEPPEVVANDLRNTGMSVQDTIASVRLDIASITRYLAQQQQEEIDLEKDGFMFVKGNSNFICF